MSRSANRLLMTGAIVAAAVSLTFASVVAQDEEGGMEEMASMEPMMEMEPGLHVMGSWARESLVTDLPAAVYLVIHNNSDADDALVGVSSPVAEFGELHLSSMDEEGMMSMNQVTEIPLPAHGDAVLEPGSYHAMLINLEAPLEAGAEVQLDLEFLAAEPQTIVAPVQAGAPMAMDDMDMDDSMEDDEG
jgi:copper(I)-binding protein